jgi:3-deoxy-D-manno-octulosonate 8-phosphate phosphatase (KDO 8-P phosphatase)
MQDILARAAKIRLVIFDVDGVLTDGRLFFDDRGREYKGFHVRDGHGIKMLQRTGVEVAVISGRASRAVALRMAGLGIQHVFQGHEDKLGAFAALCEQLQLRAEQVAHVGDDLPDLPIMRRVGLAVAVNDAHSGVRKYAHWRTANGGGAGAAREVCDLIMQAQGSLDSLIEAYL